MLLTLKRQHRGQGDVPALLGAPVAPVLHPPTGLRGQRLSWEGRVKSVGAPLARGARDGVLLVYADGQVATIPEGGLVHVSGGMPHTFETTPDSPARFFVLYTPGGSGEFHIAAAHAVQEHVGPLPPD